MMMAGWLVPLALVCVILAIFASSSAIEAAGDSSLGSVREFVVRQLAAAAWVAFGCAVGAMFLMVFIFVNGESSTDDQPAEDVVGSVEGKL
jgi:hypothetical protein